MKIPPEAKCVFQGIIFDVYQWEQEIFDGSRQTFERLKRPGTVEVIPVVGEKILLARESQPGMEEKNTFLGGRIEEGEEPLVAAKRELLEESGYVSDDWELIRIYEPISKIDWQIYVFVARNCKKVAEQKLDAGEKITVEEVNFDQFVEKVAEKDFWSVEISNEVYRMRAEGRMGELKEILFGNDA